jgi:hypothetical protein
MPKARKYLPAGICGISLVAAAGFLIHSYDTAPGGYAAGYAIGGAFSLCGLAIILGLAFLVFPQTRNVGVATLISGVLLPCVFFEGIHVSESKGWISWANEPKQVVFGPDVRASEVVYYNLGVTEAQMENFERGFFDSNPYATYFVRLSSLQAHGHDGFAIGLSPSLSKARREQIRSELVRSPLIFQVYHDVVPKDIPAP